MRILALLLISVLTQVLKPTFLFASEWSQDNLIFPLAPKLQAPGQLVQKEGFGAGFSLLDDDLFFLSWTPGRSTPPPNMTKVKRNHSVYICVFITDPAVKRTPSLVYVKKSTITTDVSYDFEVRKSDGSLYGGSKALPAWSGRPPALHTVQLACTHAEIRFEAIDPADLYTIDVIVHDNVRNVSIKLQRKLLLEN